MASSSPAEVESIIEAAIGKFEVRVGESLLQLEKDQLSRADARSGLELMRTMSRSHGSASTS